MDYDLPKIPANPRCSDHPTKSGRAIVSLKYLGLSCLCVLFDIICNFKGGRF